MDNITPEGIVRSFNEMSVKDLKSMQKCKK